MGVRQWFKERLAGGEAGADLPPGASIMEAALGRGAPRMRALGEYTRDTYPEEVAELLRRRQSVADMLLTIDVTDPGERVAAIPRLQQLLRTYPHPLAYEVLLQAYIDGGRFDEAKGVAFAARERRIQCAQSPYPEIRAETERLQEWTSADIDQLRQDRQSGSDAGLTG